MNFLEKHLELIIGIVAIIAFAIACFSFFGQGYAASESKYKVLMAEADKAHLQAIADLNKKYRQQEQDHAKDVSNIDKTNAEKLRHVQQKNKSDLAALRSGALQLHNRFICPDAGGVVSETGTNTSVGDGTSRSGLRTEDAEFFIAESDRADEIVIKLQACQQLLSADRKLTER